MSKTETKTVSSTELAKKEAELAKALEELKAARAAKEAEEAAAEAAKLEEARQKKITAAMKVCGVDSVDALIAFVKPPKAKKRKTSGKERKARVTITDEMREAIITDLMSGKNTSEVATKYSLSYGAVQRQRAEAEKRKEEAAKKTVETAA